MPIPGRTGGGCVQNGPFTFPNLKLSISGVEASTQYPEHCLRRDFSPAVAVHDMKRSAWDATLAAPDYYTMWRRLEGNPGVMIPGAPNIHNGGHNGVGGELGQMGHPFNSPADPLFYLHHGNLDRLYWLWQQKKLPQRYFDVGGPVNQYDLTGSQGNVTLNFEVHLGSLGGKKKLGQLTNTRAGPFCYTYA